MAVNMSLDVIFVVVALKLTIDNETVPPSVCSPLHVAQYRGFILARVSAENFAVVYLNK